MPTLACDHETVAGVTLVTCRLTSDRPARVTVEPTHDEPLWPPRRQGVPERGWHEDGWTGHVPADGVRALGYATSAAPDRSPARIAATEPADDEEAVTARDVVRSLGDPTPTRDAVPPTDGACDPDADGQGGTSTAAAGPTTDAGSSTIDLAVASPRDALAASTPQAAGQPEPATETDSRDPDLDAIETRLWTARDLADVSTVAEASAAVERAGGLDAVRELASQLDADRDRLTTLEERASRLREEAETVDVPVAALERLV